MFLKFKNTGSKKSNLQLKVEIVKYSRFENIHYWF